MYSTILLYSVIFTFHYFLYCVAIMALIFDLDQLIDMMSIGTLLAYTIVAICVLVLRYQNEIDLTNTNNKVSSDCGTVIRQLWNGNRLSEPTVLSSAITKIGVVLFTIVCIVWCSLDKVYPFLSMPNLISLIVVAVISILIIIVMSLQPASGVELTFKVPLVPLVPCLSVFANLYLMFQLDVFTWIRFLIWIVLGYLIYFSYGIRFSTQIQRDRNHTALAMSAADKKQLFQHTNSAFEGDIIKTNHQIHVPPKTIDIDIK